MATGRGEGSVGGLVDVAIKGVLVWTEDVVCGSDEDDGMVRAGSEVLRVIQRDGRSG